MFNLNNQTTIDDFKLNSGDQIFVFSKMIFFILNLRKFILKIPLINSLLKKNQMMILVQ